jgi:hypothetical protein
MYVGVEITGCILGAKDKGEGLMQHTNVFASDHPECGNSGVHVCMEAFVQGAGLALMMHGGYPCIESTVIVLAASLLAHVYVNRCFVCSIASCCNDSSLPFITVGLFVNASTIQASSLLFSVYLYVLDRPAVVHMHGISTNFANVPSMYSRTLLCIRLFVRLLLLQLHDQVPVNNLHVRRSS